MATIRTQLQEAGGFHIGDEVAISDGVRHCQYGSNEDMRGRIGEVYVISSIFQDSRHKLPGVMLKDAGCWTYDIGCIEPAYTPDRVLVSGDLGDLY